MEAATELTWGDRGKNSVLKKGSKNYIKVKENNDFHSNDKRRKFKSWKIDKTDGNFSSSYSIFLFGKCLHVVCTDDYVNCERAKSIRMFSIKNIEVQGRWYKISIRNRFTQKPEFA